MDRVFASVEIGRQMVVKIPEIPTKDKAPIPQALAKSAKALVEMGRLELPTPYMRSKCSTS
jgi:hypothetical protein